MSNSEIFKEFYNRCQEMDFEDTIDLALNARSDEERDFIELISNYMMQLRQKEVIAEGKF